MITFTDNESYNFAQNAWASEKDFVLATYTNGCGEVSNDQRAFWLIDHLISGPCDTCITAVADKEIGVEDAVHEVDMVWGTYKPANDVASLSASGSKKLKRQAAPDASNVTDAAANGTCGPAPLPILDGFPTATCNSKTFDEDLDVAIGYYNFDVAHYSQNLEGFIPGIGDYTPDSNEGFGPTRLSNSSGIQRRANGRKNPFSWINKRILQVRITLCIFVADYPC